MIKNKYLLSHVISIMTLLISLKANAYDTLIRVSGEIMNNTCDPSDVSVNLGDYPTSLFKVVGDASQDVKFSINLTNCGEYAKTASVTFSGTPSPDSALLQVTSSTDTGIAADGIGIELLDLNKKPIALDTQSVEYSLNDAGTNALLFYAHYKAYKTPVKGGDAEAVATFSISYN